MNRLASFRPAIAMIELIFSLVVIGITMMAVPMLLQQSSQGGFVAIQQEGINEAATRVSIIMGHFWDEQNAQQGQNSQLPNVLVTQSSNAQLAENNTTYRRDGTPLESFRNFVDKDGVSHAATAHTALGLDGGEAAGGENDVDDFGAGGLVQLSVATTDYTEKAGDVQMTTDVHYMNDNPTLGTFNNNTFRFNPNFTTAMTRSTNIKSITVRLTSTTGVAELDKNITFNAFSCNIGASILEERSF